MVDKMFDSTEEKVLPVLPLRDIVVFPAMIVPLFVGRKKSVKALEYVMNDEKQILLVTQKTTTENEPDIDDLHNVGVVGTILQMLKLPDGTVKVLVEGGERQKITKFREATEFTEAIIEDIVDTAQDDEDLEILARTVMGQFEQYVKLNKKIPPEVIVSVNQIGEPAKMADTIASHLAINLQEKQALLEIADTTERLEKIFELMEKEIGSLNIEQKVRGRVKKQMEKTQRDYYLNEQMKAIQKELSDGDSNFDELAELEDKIENTKLSEEAKEKAEAELKKLRQMSPMSAEATVVRNYLDWILSVPWKKRTRVKKDIKSAENT